MKKAVYVFFIVIGFLFLLFILSRFGLSHLQKPIYETDHQSLLAACRTMISQAETFPHKNKKPNDYFIYSISHTNPDFVQFVPREIVMLNPAYVAVSSNEVMICLSVLPRLYLLGFQMNAVEYGSERLTNGLWLSANPTRDREELKNRP